MFLHSKSIGGLRVEICCVLVFLCSSAEQTKPSTRPLGGFVRLRGMLNDIAVMGGVNCLPFEVELADLAPSYIIMLTGRLKNSVEKKNISRKFIWSGEYPNC